METLVKFPNVMLVTELSSTWFLYVFVDHSKFLRKVETPKKHASYPSQDVSVIAIPTTHKVINNLSKH